MERRMPTLPELWEICALLVAVQTASFAWRLAEESRVSRKGDITWVPVADALNLVAIAVLAFGVFVLPVAGLLPLRESRIAVALSILLFVGHLVSVAAHYELFNPRTARSMKYFPRQERVAVTIVCAVVVIFLIAVAMTRQEEENYDAKHQGSTAGLSRR